MSYKKITVTIVSIIFIYLIILIISFFNPIQNEIISMTLIDRAGFNNELYVSGNYIKYDDSKNEYSYFTENGYSIYRIINHIYYYNEELYPDAKIIEEDNTEYFLLSDDKYIETEREPKKLNSPFTFEEIIHTNYYEKVIIPKYNYEIIISNKELNDNDILNIRSIAFLKKILFVEKCEKKDSIKEFN